MSFDEEAARAERRRVLERELARIRGRLRRPGVRKVILIGSMARGEVTPFSDLDLVIVQDTDKRYLDRLNEWGDHLDARCALDLFVYTPGEFEEMRERPFLRHALQGAEVLLEA